MEYSLGPSCLLLPVHLCESPLQDSQLKMYDSLSRSSSTQNRKFLAMQVWYIGLEMGNLGQLNIFVQEFVDIDAKSILPAFYSSGEEWTRGAVFDLCGFRFHHSCGAWETAVSKGGSLLSATVSADRLHMEGQQARRCQALQAVARILIYISRNWETLESDAIWFPSMKRLQLNSYL